MSTFSGTPTRLVTPFPSATSQYRYVNAVSKLSGSLLQPSMIVVPAGSPHCTVTGWRYHPPHEAGAGSQLYVILGGSCAAAGAATARARAAISNARFIRVPPG